MSKAVPSDEQQKLCIKGEIDFTEIVPLNHKTNKQINNQAIKT